MGGARGKIGFGSHRIQKRYSTVGGWKIQVRGEHELGKNVENSGLSQDEEDCIVVAKFVEFIISERNDLRYLVDIKI